MYGILFQKQLLMAKEKVKPQHFDNIQVDICPCLKFDDERAKDKVKPRHFDNIYVDICPCLKFDDERAKDKINLETLMTFMQIFILV